MICLSLLTFFTQSVSRFIHVAANDIISFLLMAEKNMYFF